MQKDNLDGFNKAYMRVSNGNVLIGACDKHFNEIRAKLMTPADGERVVMRMNEDTPQLNQVLDDMEKEGVIDMFVKDEITKRMKPC